MSRVVLFLSSRLFLNAIPVRALRLRRAFPLEEECATMGELLHEGSPTGSSAPSVSSVSSVSSVVICRLEIRFPDVCYGKEQQIPKLAEREQEQPFQHGDVRHQPIELESRQLRKPVLSDS